MRSSSKTSGAHAVHVDLAPPPAAAFVTGMSAIAPDARNVAFVARSAGGTSLWVHSFETGVNRQIPGTDGAAFPFWSADSRSVAFFAAGALRRVDISGSAGPVVVCEAPVGRGGAWNASGVVIFNAVNDGPLLRVAASGGTPIALTAMERTENSHRFPAFFADGEHFVYFARGTDRNTQGIYLSSLSDPRHRSLLVRSTTSGTIATSPLDHHEYLLWIESAALRTQRIEPTAGLVGQPTTLMESVGLGGAVGQSPLSASHDGNLIIETAPDAKTQLSWYGRDGKISVHIGDLDTYRDARLSPDGRTIAVLKYDRQWDVWLIDVERGVPSRLTFEGAGAGATTNDFAWSPDGQRLAFANGAAPPNIVARVIGGPPVDERLAESRGSQTCPDWSTDGAWLLYTEIPNDPASKTRSDLYARRMDVAGARPISYLASTFGEKNGRFSPDAQWVAYTSDESGRDEVYVASFPAGRGKWRISIAGGDFPRWRADGRELFYAAPDAMLMAVTVRTTSSSLQFGAPIALFKVQGPPGSFDVAADGQRVLALTATGSERSNVVLIVNWPAVVPKNDGNVR